MTNRYYCKNTDGKDLFFVELLNEPFLDRMWLQFSFEPKFVLTDDIERIVRCIEERLVSEPLRIKFLDKLFDHIKSVPGIERLYFPESVLRHTGTLMEENYQIQREIAWNFEPEPYTPVTIKDGLLFDYYSPYLYFVSIRPNANEVPRSIFERETEKETELCEMYYELKDATAKFFAEYYEEDGQKKAIYWMIVNDEPVLFFTGNDFSMKNR